MSFKGQIKSVSPMEPCTLGSKIKEMLVDYGVSNKNAWDDKKFCNSSTKGRENYTDFLNHISVVSVPLNRLVHLQLDGSWNPNNTLNTGVTIDPLFEPNLPLEKLEPSKVQTTCVH